MATCRGNLISWESRLLLLAAIQVLARALLRRRRVGIRAGIPSAAASAAAHLLAQFAISLGLLRLLRKALLHVLADELRQLLLTNRRWEIRNLRKPAIVETVPERARESVTERLKMGTEVVPATEILGSERDERTATSELAPMLFVGVRTQVRNLPRVRPVNARGDIIERAHLTETPDDAPGEEIRAPDQKTGEVVPFLLITRLIETLDDPVARPVAPLAGLLPIHRLFEQLHERRHLTDVLMLELPQLRLVGLRPVMLPLRVVANLKRMCHRLVLRLTC